MAEKQAHIPQREHQKQNVKKASTLTKSPREKPVYPAPLKTITREPTGPKKN